MQRPGARPRLLPAARVRGRRRRVRDRRHRPPRRRHPHRRPPRPPAPSESGPSERGRSSAGRGARRVPAESPPEVVAAGRWSPPEVAGWTARLEPVDSPAGRSMVDAVSRRGRPRRRTGRRSRSVASDLDSGSIGCPGAGCSMAIRSWRSGSKTSRSPNAMPAISAPVTGVRHGCSRSTPGCRRPRRSIRHPPRRPGQALHLLRLVAVELLERLVGSPTALDSHESRLPSGRLGCQRRPKEPMGQTLTKARPMIWDSAMAPKTRLSLEFGRLSPMTQ